MTAYEKELLALAYESVTRVRGDDVRLVVGPDDYDTDHAYAGTVNYAGDRNGWTKPTLAEALTALLRDLGVEVPERPSVNTKTASGVSIRALEGLFTYGQWAGSLVHLRSLYAREPLIVLALLEGGES